ncbi:MAG TPA: hypothetical protein PK637_01275 [Flavobacteriales bacterium]|nr:hypothetical protein [Flavobacteriales bacterium]HRE95363.1 hypothetical protein [Flavobacteriales bacterium]HRJ38123.1 hypothetical protein [Flavobacteriales bacterium]
MKNYLVKSLVLLFFLSSIMAVVLYRSGYFEKEQQNDPVAAIPEDTNSVITDSLVTPEEIPDTVIVESEEEMKRLQDQEFQLMMTSKSLSPSYPKKIYKVVPPKKKTNTPATKPKKEEPELIIIPSSKSGPVFTPVQQEEEK